ncbi:MAG: MauE/DoxX family redox-associated membrane protein [Chitinophagales bacterium]
MKLLSLFPQLLRVLLGTIFILSGVLKLYPIEPFELNFIELGIGNWYTAPFIARLLISFELLLGLFLILNLALKSFTLKAVVIMLVFFTCYLLIQIISEGNNGNCGCFGTYLQMTPLESIVKNILLITVAIFLRAFHKDSSARFTKLLIPVFLIISISLPFILNPIDLMAANYRQPESVNFPFDQSLIFNDTVSQKNIVDFSTGKHIVAFFSLTCPHCKSTAFKMHIIEKRHPEIPFFMVLNGKQKNLQPFFEETKSGNVPYTILLGEPFARITGGNVPTVYWIDNGIVVRKSLYISLEEQEILKWLNTP